MEFIHVQLGPSVHAFCEEHFARAIEEIFPEHPADLADPEEVDGLPAQSHCSWCKAEKSGRNFASRFLQKKPQPEPESFLGT